MNQFLEDASFFSKKIFNFAIKVKESNYDQKSPLKFYNATSQRDWGYAEEYCSIFFEAANKDITGKFILGTGNIISVEDFIVTVFNLFQIKFKKGINSNGLLEFYDQDDKIIAVEVSRDPIDEGRKLAADNRLIKEAFNIKEFSKGIEVIKKLYDDHMMEA
jgi:GDP-D-mannose dehydratase